MTAALEKIGISEIHTHSLVDFVPGAPDHMIALVKALDVRWEVNLHDYKTICPRINLVDEKGFYCGEPSQKACCKCLSQAGSDFQVTDIDAWRAMHRRALLAADQVLVPDVDPAERLCDTFLRSLSRFHRTKTLILQKCLPAHLSLPHMSTCASWSSAPSARSRALKCFWPVRAKRGSKSCPLILF
jgi:hypothetical protein